MKNGDALAPPSELRNLSLDALIHILTSAKPLAQALADCRRRQHGKKNTEDIAVDPHKRVDTSAFLLQRTRRVAWALSALRQRLGQPVFSEQALCWRLRGPIGASSLCRAIMHEARSDAERCFLQTELCLELSRVRPRTASGSLSSDQVQAGIENLLSELRADLVDVTIDQQPVLSASVKAAVAELS